jgi:hypothetical protein
MALPLEDTDLGEDCYDDDSWPKARADFPKKAREG